VLSTAQEKQEKIDQDALFGRIAVEQGHITPDQLVEAVLVQSREAGARKLGEILLDTGTIGSDQLLVILKEQRQRLGGPAMVAVPPARPTGAPPAAPTAAAAPATPTAAPAPAPAAPASVASPVATRSATAPPAAAPGVALRLDQLLRETVALGASDLHLHSASRPRVRVAGSLREMGATPLPAEQLTAMIRAALPAELLAKLDAEKQIDFVHAVDGVGRFRASAYRQQRGLDIVLRAIPPQPPTLASLGLPPELAKLTHHHQGLVLITGPSGCGKTSTLAALINLINQERAVHILTAEEPIEYIQASKRALVNQREIGPHTESYARMLRGALREDPDVIALGDLRDHASISLALTAAETGHLVIATMHTGGAIRTINRLIGAFPPNEQDQVRVMVSESLRAIVSQRLVPRKDGSGRVPAVEVLIATRAVSNLIRERKTFQIENLLQLGTADGMCTLEQSLDRMVAAGIVDRAGAAPHRPESFIMADLSGAANAGK
jgi:twitching motility protein PilT